MTGHAASCVTPSPRIDVLTLFPGWFDGPLRESLLGTALRDGAVDVRLHDLRDWATDRHRSVDDTPYGGGAGMVMRADVVIDAAEAVWNDIGPAEISPAERDGSTSRPVPFRAGGDRPRTIILTPRGRPFSQRDARALAAEERFVLICGRYEGIDERAHELVATDEISVGDYVLFGGEVAAAVVIEAVTRLVGGVLGNEQSPDDESFSSNLLEYPHYTRPPQVRGLAVPEILLSGNHLKIDKWRREEAERLTRMRRPDLLE